MATTSAVFEKNGQLFYGTAKFDYLRPAKPWTAWLTTKGEWYMMLGNFKTVDDAWKAARKHLDIPPLDDLLPRTQGDQTDGPMNKEEEP